MGKTAVALYRFTAACGGAPMWLALRAQVAWPGRWAIGSRRRAISEESEIDSPRGTPRFESQASKLSMQLSDPVGAFDAGDAIARGGAWA